MSRRVETTIRRTKGGFQSVRKPASITKRSKTSIPGTNASVARHTAREDPIATSARIPADRWRKC